MQQSHNESTLNQFLEFICNAIHSANANSLVSLGYTTTASQHLLQSTQLYYSQQLKNSTLLLKPLTTHEISIIPTICIAGSCIFHCLCIVLFQSVPRVAGMDGHSSNISFNTTGHGVAHSTISKGQSSTHCASGVCVRENLYSATHSVKVKIYHYSPQLKLESATKPLEQLSVQFPCW